MTNFYVSCHGPFSASGSRTVNGMPPHGRTAAIKHDMSK